MDCLGQRPLSTAGWGGGGGGGGGGQLFYSVKCISHWYLLNLQF